MDYIAGDPGDVRGVAEQKKETIVIYRSTCNPFFCILKIGV